MDFILKVILSFLVGGAFVSGIVWASERLGSRVGGAIAGIPSTLLISLAFISETDGSAAAQSASAIVPIMIVAALFYSWVFVQVAGASAKANRHLIATIVATLMWLVVAVAVRAAFSHASFLVILLAALIGTLVFNYVLRHFKAVKAGKLSLPSNIYIVRFVVAGVVIAGAVVAARLLGSVWGGVVSSFPATIASSVYFLNKSQGYEFTKGFVRRLPVAFTSTQIFIIILHETLTVIATPLSFLVALAAALLYTTALVSLRQKF